MDTFSLVNEYRIDLTKLNDGLKSGMMYKTRLLVSAEAVVSFIVTSDGLWGCFAPSFSSVLYLGESRSLFYNAALVVVLEIMMTSIQTRENTVEKIVYLFVQLHSITTLHAIGTPKKIRKKMKVFINSDSFINLLNPQASLNLTTCMYSRSFPSVFAYVSQVEPWIIPWMM